MSEEQKNKKTEQCKGSHNGDDQIRQGNKEKKKKSKYYFLFRFLRKTAVYAVLVWFALTYLFAVRRMSGNAMSPYVRDGDLTIYNRMDRENIYLNDVVLYEDADGNEHVGRVVAGNGQEVDFPESGGYRVNGYLTSEEILYETYAAENSEVSYPIELGEDEYFILNDFRSMTSDSREFGAVKRSQIKGKILCLFRWRNH